MVDTDPVSVTVEIINDFSDDIEELRGELKSLEDEIGVALDINDGELDLTKAKIENLDDIIDILVKFEDQGYLDTLAKKETLAKDETATISYDHDVPAGPLRDDLDQNLWRSINPENHASFEGWTGKSTLGGPGDREGGDHIADSTSHPLRDSVLNHADFEEAFTGKTQVGRPYEDSGGFEDVTKNIRGTLRDTDLRESMENAAVAEGYDPSSLDYGISGTTNEAIKEMETQLDEDTRWRDNIENAAAFEGWTGKSRAGGPGSGRDPGQHIANTIKKDTLNPNEVHNAFSEALDDNSRESEFRNAIDRLTKDNVVRTVNKQNTGEFIKPWEADRATSFDYSNVGSDFDLDRLKNNKRSSESLRGFISRINDVVSQDLSGVNSLSEIDPDAVREFNNKMRLGESFDMPDSDTRYPNPYWHDTPDRGLTSGLERGQVTSKSGRGWLDSINDKAFTSSISSEVGDWFNRQDVDDSIREAVENAAATEGWSGKTSVSRDTEPRSGPGFLENLSIKKGRWKGIGKQAGSDFHSGFMDNFSLSSLKGEYQTGFNQGSWKAGKDGFDSPFKSMGGMFQRGLSGGGNGGNPFGEVLSKLKPNMRTWMNLIAAVMPMIVTLIAAIGGLVAALGAVAIAGAAAFAIGSWGIDDMQARIQRLQDEIKAVFQPAQEAFAPILRGFMSKLPNRLQPLAEAVTELTAFEGILNGSFVGLVNWLSEAITRMSKFTDEINVILDALGSALGDSLIDFLQWLVVETARNREQFMRIAKVFGDVIAIVYNLSKALSFAIAFFEPLFAILAKVTDLLSNRFAVGALVAVGTVLALSQAIATLAKVSLTSMIGSLAKGIGMLYGYVEAMLAAIGVTSTFASVLAMTGIGAIAVGAGYLASQSMMPDTDIPQSTGAGGMATGAGGSGGGGNTYITVEGDVGRDEMNKLNDKFDSKWETYSGREEEREQ